jgi:CubicO group peptidase (beta-lactamase class C family)
MHRLLPILALAFLSVQPLSAQPFTLKETNVPTAAGFSPERLQRLDRFLQQYVADKKQVGIIGFVSRNGQIVYHKAFGKNGPKQDSLLRREAIFRIASQTKAITSLAVLMLFEEGYFLLDDPISLYIPAFKNPVVLDKFNERDSSYTTKPATREITIRHLLTHTAGISYTSIGTKEANAIYAKANIPSGIGTPFFSLSASVNALAKLPLMHNPGERFTYSLSTDVLGRLVEIIAKQPLDRFFRTRIFEPLGMTDTYFYLPDAKHNRLGTLYTENKDRRPEAMGTQGNQSPDYPNQAGQYFSGGAGLVSTAYDYAIFLQMLLNGGSYNGKVLLAPATVNMMLSNQIGSLSLGDRKFGLGFGLATEASEARQPSYADTFDWGGFFGTNYWADPKTGLIGIVMTQKVPNTYVDLNDKFKVLVYQALVAPGKVPAAAKKP